MKIVVVGSLNRDLTYRLDHIPLEGETIIAKERHTGLGGKGHNQAVALARLGSEVIMIGAIGEDNGGEMLLNSLKREGIESQGVMKKDGSTGEASIYLDKEGRNNIVVYPGANLSITTEDIDEHEYLFEQAGYCVLQWEIPTEVIVHVLKKAKKYGMITVFNPAPAQEKFPEEILSLVDLLIPNETELQIISGREEGSSRDLAKDLRNRGVKSILVTLGEKGSYYVDQKIELEGSIFPVQAVDTTGAGDAFIGGFVTALSQGKPVKEAMEYAAAVSALAVTKLGASESLPKKVEVENFLKKI